MGSCIFPQSIEQYQPPPVSYTPPPVIDLGSVTPGKAILCRTQGGEFNDVDHDEFGVDLGVALGAGAQNQTLYVRWFLDYSIEEGNTRPLQLPTGTPSPDGVTMVVQPTDAGTYASPSYPSLLLNLSKAKLPVNALEEVISNGFADPSVHPQNRAAATGSYVTSYKWVIEFVSSGCCTDGSGCAPQ
jgi:hypothetical protein